MGLLHVIVVKYFQYFMSENKDFLNDGIDVLLNNNNMTECWFLRPIRLVSSLIFKCGEASSVVKLINICVKHICHNNFIVRKCVFCSAH